MDLRVLETMYEVQVVEVQPSASAGCGMYLLLGGAALLLIALWMSSGPSGRMCAAPRAPVKPVAVGAAVNDQRAEMSRVAAANMRVPSSRSARAPSALAARRVQIE